MKSRTPRKRPVSAFIRADVAFVAALARAVMRVATVRPGADGGDGRSNTTGGALIRPGGRYPAFWIRDFAMSLESGFVPVSVLRHAIRVTAAAQTAATTRTATGGIIPADAIPDHINFDGGACFYPGTMDPANQGGEPWGVLPPLDNHYYFVHMVCHLVRETGNTAILRQRIAGRTILERLEAAYRVPPADPKSKLVCCGPENRGVGFGFCDAVYHTGLLLFCSLLKHQAALELADLLGRLGEPQRARVYRAAARTLRHWIPKTFFDDDGWLRASTGVSAQPDVWGTAFAVYGGALRGADRLRACATLTSACRNGTIAWRGNIRHVPTDRQFSAESAWERTAPYPYTQLNVYQNGAYWSTPTGWACCAITQVDRPLARRLAADYVAELREGDFRQGGASGSPWECMHPENDYRQNPVYLTSVTCPLAAFQRLWSGGHGQTPHSARAVSIGLICPVNQA